MSTPLKEPESDHFRLQFARHRRVIHRARLQRDAVTGASVGLLLGGLVSGGAWWLSADWWLRAAPALLGVVGAGLGLYVALSRRLSDEEVGLFLDARLGSENEISTALGADGGGQLLAHVRQRATGLLQTADPRGLRPRSLSGYHSSALLGMALTAAAAWLEPPLVQAEQEARPASPLAMSGLEGFESLKQLDQLRAIDTDQSKRLQAIAAAARKLEEDSKHGMTEREVLSEMSKLRDAITAELGELGNEGNRAGLAAAVDALNEREATRRAAKALGDGDLIRFDQEMKRLAAEAEKQDRGAAKDALEKAEQAARQHGAKGLAEELAEQQQRLQSRQLTADLMKELDGLMQQPAEPGTTPKQPHEPLSGQSADNLSEAMEEALKQLTPAERQQLAERLKQGIQDGTFDFKPEDKQRLEQMAEQLGSEQGRQKLAENLRKLAQPSQGAERQQKLKDALKGLGQAQRGLGENSIPIPKSGAGMPGSGQTGSEDGTPSPGRGGGKGKHEGQTKQVQEAESLRAKSDPHFDLTQPLLEASQGRAPARAGETANARGVSGLDAVKAGELLGVEHAPVPAEYREQVSRYFSPE